jgi:alkylation response protein AidB-like acyl-CoA dehydrogenase
MTFPDSARTLRAAIAAAASEIEQTRRLPAPLVAAFVEAGLFRMYAPRALGGPECHPLVVARTMAELAHGDASAAWCAMIASQCTWFAAFLPPDGAQEVFGDPRSIVGAQTRPEGEAMTVEGGGYRVRGRWPFISGVSHAQWVGLVCHVVADRIDPGAARRVMAFIATRELSVLDTWHTSGLRGTGSHDVEVSDVFVPRHRVFAFPAIDSVGHASPLYRDAVFNLVFVAQAGQALGVAEAALEEFVEIASSTKRQGAGMALREQATVQTQVAEARVIVDAAWAYLERATNDVWNALSAQRSPSAPQRLVLRLAITHAIQTAIRAGDVLHTAAGGSAVYTSHPLNRRFRDLHAAGAHMQASPRVYEVAGQILLGLDPKPGPLSP